jgi:hypothetical protein
MYGGCVTPTEVAWRKSQAVRSLNLGTFVSLSVGVTRTSAMIALTSDGAVLTVDGFYRTPRTATG